MVVGGACWEYANRQMINVYEKKTVPGGCLPLPGGCIHIYDHNIQIYCLKPLGHSKPNFMWSIVREGVESLYKWSRSDDQDGRDGCK